MKPLGTVKAKEKEWKKVFSPLWRCRFLSMGFCGRGLALRSVQLWFGMGRAAKSNVKGLQMLLGFFEDLFTCQLGTGWEAARPRLCRGADGRDANGSWQHETLGIVLLALMLKELKGCKQPFLEPCFILASLGSLFQLKLLHWRGREGRKVVINNPLLFFMVLFIQGSKVLRNGAVSFVSDCWCWRAKRAWAAHRGFGCKSVLEPGVKSMEWNESFWGLCCLRVEFGRVGCWC